MRWRLFGSEPRVRRPVVLLVVFGVLLVLVGVTATAQAAMVTTYASTSSIAATVDADVGTCVPSSRVSSRASTP